MQISVDRSDFLKAIVSVRNVVERRNTIPILANVLLEANADGLTVSATDMEIAITATLKAEVKRGGKTTVCAETLHEVVRRQREGTLTLTSDSADAPLALRAGRYSTSLPTLSAEDFPALRDERVQTTFSIPARGLKDALAHAKASMSTEETRYYLNGIFVHLADADGAPTLRLVSTDGHRLSRIDVPRPEMKGPALKGVIIPRKAIAEIAKLLDGVAENVNVRISESRLTIAAPRVTLITKLIDGSFPEYDRVIPKDNGNILTVQRRLLADVVARVAAVSGDKGQPVKFTLTQGSAVISTTTTGGSATEELEDGAFTYSGDPVEVGFQSRYLAELLDNIKTTAEFRFHDGQCPAVIFDTNDSSLLFVLMPIRV